MRGRSRCYPEWLGITQMPPLSLPSRPTSLKNLPYRRVVTRLSTPNVVDCTRRSSYPLKTFFLYFKCRQIVIDPTAKWSARHPNGKPHPTRHCLYIRMLYLSRCVCVCDHIKKEKKKKKVSRVVWADVLSNTWLLWRVSGSLPFCPSHFIINCSSFPSCLTSLKATGASGLWNVRSFSSLIFVVVVFEIPWPMPSFFFSPSRGRSRRSQWLLQLNDFWGRQQRQ